MSHSNERLEKNCLNCNAQLDGRYCHICGQENIAPKETVWHLVAHFFQDITHFDGKFFSTLKLLLLRPGFLSREYMAGRRASYLNPVRMYVFTSAFFFLIFFSFFRINQGEVSVDPATRMDSTKKNGLSITGISYTSKAQYDSALAGGKKHNWLQKLIIYKVIEIKSKYHNNGDQILQALLSNLLHSLPQMLFFSLPLLALLLKLLYVRRKNFFYADHGIFSIHLYIFIFIAMLIVFGLAELNAQLDSKFISFIIVMINVSLFFYEYKAMRNFYQQRRGKTIAKFLLLNLMFLIVLILLFAVFFFLSIFKI